MDSLFSLVCLNRTSTGGALRWCSPGGVTCTTQAGGAAPGVHPVPLHPLEQPESRHGHLVGLLPELQHVGKARDVETGVCGERGEGAVTTCTYTNHCVDVTLGSPMMRHVCTDGIVRHFG